MYTASPPSALWRLLPAATGSVLIASRPGVYRSIRASRKMFRFISSSDQNIPISGGGGASRGEARQQMLFLLCHCTVRYDTIRRQIFKSAVKNWQGACLVYRMRSNRYIDPKHNQQMWHKSSNKSQLTGTKFLDAWCWHFPPHILQFW